MVKVDQQVANFILPSTGAREFSLAQHLGKHIVIYFYPKDDTSGCTKEACDFRDSLAPIKKAGAVVIGVSKDGKASHQKFIAKYGLPFALLSDEETVVCNAYGVYKEKSMYGRKYLGIERSTFVIDATGRIKALFRKVKVPGHVDEVLAALKA